MSNYIGIDLGTTYSAVATIDATGRPKIIENNGKSITPSCVMLENDKLIVGDIPEKRYGMPGFDVGARFKRYMGEEHTTQLGSKSFTPTDLSAAVLKEMLNIDTTINYYGMIEQTGSIFFECKNCNNFITSIYSDIIIRDKYLNDIGFNKKGMIQLISVLPTSYPGHNILTEDVGMILGEDDCSCGKMGKRFKVYGRLKKSEVRGCSDAIS